MPAQYGEITGYHHREVVRHEALAQEACKWGNMREAEYQLRLAATHRNTVLEQEQVIGLEPPTVSGRPRIEQKLPLAIRGALAVLAGAEKIAKALRSTPQAMPEPSGHKHIKNWVPKSTTPDLHS